MPGCGFLSEAAWDLSRVNGEPPNLQRRCDVE
jgi:hypothetical protein